ncbi:major capsid protein [Shinella sp. PSBB067]|uniref:major capsid protein n=1 Tax=Shinella sp. PSBB067 TaxID=2715959 RepID=UPI00193B416F|nr:major capsid protein [Shinella sp. PSBB067]QRI61821.1 major capsid protein [Shinella sp. PSBB067]
MLDIFNSDAFSIVSLTDALSELRPRSSRLGDMGLFEVESVHTTKVAIERIGDTIQLVTPSPRGAPGETRDMPKRTIQDLTIPHFQRDWSVYADSVQNIRAFGTESQLQTVQGVVMREMKTHVDDLDLTDEYARLGAVQGIVTYKGGQTLDLFSTFGVAPPEEIDFDLDNADPIDGVLRERCTRIIRAARKSAGAISFNYVHALVGDNFFDNLLKHREVRETYRGWSESRILQESYVGKNRASNPIFEFGGIVWENYGAIDDEGDGALVGIGTDYAKFFPVGLKGLFRTYYAPADYSETVNTFGKPTYAKQWPMPNDKGIRGEMQRNVLHICTRPGLLQRARRT